MLQTTLGLEPHTTMAKPAKKATKKAAVKKSAVKKEAATKTAAKKAAVKKTAVKKTAVKKTAAKKAAAPKKAAKKPASAKVITTTIVAKIDVGFENTLVIRGDGPGLSWDSGVTMENLGPDTWQWSTTKANNEFEVKFLVNDDTWCDGENLVVKPGSSVGITPAF